VKVRNLRNLEAYAVATPTYGSEEFRETMLYQENDEFTVDYPNTIYITLLAPEKAGDFYLEYQYRPSSLYKVQNCKLNYLL
jgi:hypothetical protein